MNQNPQPTQSTTRTSQVFPQPQAQQSSENVIGKKYILSFGRTMQPEDKIKNARTGYQIWGITMRSRKFFKVLLFVALIGLLFVFVMSGINLGLLPFLIFLAGLFILLTYFVNRIRTITEITFYPDKIKMKDLEKEDIFFLKDVKIYRTFGLINGGILDPFYIKHNNDNNLYVFIPNYELLLYVMNLPQVKDLRILWYISIPILTLIAYLLFLLSK